MQTRNIKDQKLAQIVLRRHRRAEMQRQAGYFDQESEGRTRKTDRDIRNDTADRGLAATPVNTCRYSPASAVI